MELEMLPAASLPSLLSLSNRDLELEPSASLSLLSIYTAQTDTCSSYTQHESSHSPSSLLHFSYAYFCSTPAHEPGTST
jgi:hypothetical protein